MGKRFRLTLVARQTKMTGREDRGGGKSLARTILRLAPDKDGLSPHPLQGGMSRRPLRVPLIKGQQRALPSGDTVPALLLPPVCGDQGDPQGYHSLRTAERLPPGDHSTCPAAPHPRAGVPERQAGWLPVTSRPICTLPDWME